MVFAVTKFQRMLMKLRFKLQTDHQPLVEIFGSKKDISIHTANRLKRCALTLLGYVFNIEFVSTTIWLRRCTKMRLINNHKCSVEEFVLPSLNVELDL